MKEIKLNNGLVALVDDEDYLYLMNWNWHAHKWGNNNYYARRGERPSVYMHNLILNTSGLDHIDRNGLNNQKYNLRVANYSQNGCNRPGWGNSKYKGITFHKPTQKWLAQITVHQNKKHLGLFQFDWQAAKAYNEAAKDLHGEFALLNKV